MSDNELRTKLAALLGTSLDTPDVELLGAVNDLLALRKRVETDAARERRIAELQQVTHCTRATALDILAAQDNAQHA
jgi:hypothetical protein